MELFQYVEYRNKLLNGDRNVPEEMFNKNYFVSLRKENNMLYVKTDGLTIDPVKLYDFLLKITFPSYVKVTVSLLKGNKQESVSKKLLPSENLQRTVKELIDLPHDEILEILIESNAFKLRVYGSSADLIIPDVSINAVFRGLALALFPLPTKLFKDSVEEKYQIKEEEGSREVQITEIIDGENAGSKFIRI